MARPAIVAWWALRAVAGGAATAAAILVGASKPAPVAVPAMPAPEVRGGPDQWAFRLDGWTVRVDRGEDVGPVVLPARPVAVPPPIPAMALISPYDQLIYRHAAAEGLDWRLVAALMYEESRFIPDRVSSAGAIGLMQVRPIAAEAVGAEEFHAPEDNIRTGVRYLKKLVQRFYRPKGRDRLALVLAAYHMGPGHVRDAQLLAMHFGYDPRRWENSMDLILPLLEDPDYAERLAHGFAQGRLTVAYVNRILTRYERYKIQVTEAPATLDPPGQAASATG